MKGLATKKPVKINFYEWDGQLLFLSEWLDEFKDNLTDHFLEMSDEDHSIKVKTLEGTSYKVPLGYIIIRGVKGEYYPCEPGIFHETYNTL